jgi:hypothetical protein
MNKFKVGDNIRCVNKGDYGYLTEGGVYTVKEVGPRFVRVFNDRGVLQTHYSSRFELVEKEGTYILILEESGVLKPASEPKVYTSERRAKFVAEEMAVKHPGSKVIVFKAFGEVSVPKVEAELKVY